MCDVSRAYFYAPAIRPVYVKIIGEDFELGDENRCGRLNVSMYGARGAAMNWHEHYKEHLDSLNVRKERKSGHAG